VEEIATRQRDQHDPGLVLDSTKEAIRCSIQRISQFQFSTQQQQDLCTELSSLLEMIQDRQGRLEKENSCLKQAWTITMSMLKSKESEVLRMKEQLTHWVDFQGEPIGSTITTTATATNGGGTSPSH